MRTLNEKITTGDLIWVEDTNELGVVKNVFNDGIRCYVTTNNGYRGDYYYLTQVKKISVVDTVKHFFINEDMKPYLLTRMVWIKTGIDKKEDINKIDPLVKKCMRFAPK